MSVYLDLMLLVVVEASGQLRPADMPPDDPADQVLSPVVVDSSSITSALPRRKITTMPRRRRLDPESRHLAAVIPGQSFP
ncbi:unnamed protein product [Boreogadus saida]